jgi:prepilin-type N-terminal cleavage/methylation domain-containing protein
MKRAGFTMIELIFVIVILGILSAVALPKFIGISEQAQAGKCKAFVGTLNRTVFPALWANMALNDQNETTAFTATTIGDQIEVPEGCGTLTQFATLANAGTAFSVHPAAAGDGSGATGAQYDVNGTKATASVSPIVEWNKH